MSSPWIFSLFQVFFYNFLRKNYWSIIAKAITAWIFLFELSFSMSKCLAFASPLACNIKVCTKLIEKLWEHRLAQFRKWTESVCRVQQLNKYLLLISLTSNIDQFSFPSGKRLGKTLFGTFWWKWRWENGPAPVLCSHYLWLSSDSFSQTPQLISSLILLQIFRRTLPTEVKKCDCSKFNTALTCILQNWNGTFWT